MEVSWLVLGVMVAICASQTDAVNVTITAKRASASKNGSVELMCDIGIAAQGCTFNVWLNSYDGIHTNIQQIDLENQHASGTFYRPSETNASFQAEYHGQGLDKGQCGLKMFGLTPGMYFVGCRVRTATSGWTYDYMALVVHSSDGSRANSKVGLKSVDFEMVKVNQTRPRSIDFTMKQSTGMCDLFFVYQIIPELIEGKETRTQLDKYNKDQSGKTITFDVTLNKVSSGGVMWCLCRKSSSTNYTEFNVKILTVLKVPESPNISVARTNYTEGETLTATCLAKFARPVARIVWKLGDDVIRNDTDDDNVDEPRLDIDPNDLQEPKNSWPWRWPWSTKSIKQVLNRPMLTLKENGTYLSCQVLHPGLTNGSWRFDSSTITINPGENPIVRSQVVLYVGVILGVVLVALLAGAVIFLMRKKRFAVTKAKGRNTGSTSFIIDNDLYQSHSDARSVHREAPGARSSYQAENPYDELTPVMPDSHPQAAPSSRQSAVYENVVQYAEVVIGSNGGQPPPKKPPAEEACLYAEVVKDSKPPPKKPINPEAVYAQVVKGQPAGSKPPPKAPEAVYAQVNKPKR